MLTARIFACMFLVAGLNMLNTTNLDYFSPQHQAEIFR